jgi:hypothetical protein
MPIINQKAALALLQLGIAELVTDSDNYTERAVPFSDVKPGQSFRLIVFAQIETETPLEETMKLYAYLAENSVNPFDAVGGKMAVFPEDAIGIIYDTTDHAVRFKDEYVGLSVLELRTKYRKLAEDRQEETHAGALLKQILLCFYGNHDGFMQEMMMLVCLRDL